MTLVPPRLASAHGSAFRRWADGHDEHLDGRYLRLPALTASGDEVPVGMVLNPIDGPDGQDLVLALIRPRDAPHEAVNAVALELVSVLSQELPVEEAVDGLLRAIGERLDWDVVNLWVVDESRGRLRALGAVDRGWGRPRRLRRGDQGHGPRPRRGRARSGVGHRGPLPGGAAGR